MKDCSVVPDTAYALYRR